MKGFVFILIAVVLLYLVYRFVIKRSVNIEADLSRLFEKKIPYSVNYNGLQFTGVFDIEKDLQEGSGIVKVAGKRSPGRYEIQVIEKGKVIKSLAIDLYKLKIFIKA